MSDPTLLPPDDYHSWVRPQPAPCPHCQCCTANLCATARDREVPCSHIGHSGPGLDLTACPCAALAGPWQAVLADEWGWPVDIDNQPGPDADGYTSPLCIHVVRGTAAPAGRGHRLPGVAGYGCREDGDVLYEWDDDLGDPGTLRMRWVQAQAVANVLNRAAEAQR